MSLVAGARLGPYEIISLLGAGGMGEVFKARDTRLKRDVAIKVLPESFAANPDRLRRFHLEAQTAGGLSHPNVLVVYDIGSLGDSPYLVSELLEGESLRQRLAGGRLPQAKSLDYATQIASGLAAAHAKGIIHRDIKPENLFLTKDGRIKILDFGLAKLAPEALHEDSATKTGLTSPGSIMGTTTYMSPEQVRGQPVDPRSDIFSFGCVLYEMLTQETAFGKETAAETMHAILKEEPPLLLASDGKMAPAVDRILRHCLEKDPDNRFQSARDVIFAIESLSNTSRAESKIELAPAKRRWIKPAIAALAAVAVLMTGAFLGRNWAKPRDSGFHRLTFRRGRIHAARFTPDGHGVVYSAQWEGEPSELFTARFEIPGSRALNFPGAELRAVSPSGELALTQNTKVAANSFAPSGMLSRAPFSGGAPRPVEDRVDFADWSPDGAEMAVVRETDRGTQLEFPAGQVIYRTAGYISSPRISLSGDRVAFLDHPLNTDNAGSVQVVDRAGQKKVLTGTYRAADGLAWSPTGDEVWFTAAKSGNRYELRAVDLRGHERMLLRESVAIVLQDVSKDGRILLANLDKRMKLQFRGKGDTAERELSGMDWSLLNSLSDDGKLVAFSETGEGSGPNPLSFLRETSGTPAVSLGAGRYPALSLDGQSVVSFENSAISVSPVGPGQARRVDFPGFSVARAGLLPDGNRLWFNGNEASHGPRYYATDLDGAKPQPISPEGVRTSPPWGLLLNGKYLAGVSGGKIRLYPIGGGEPEILKGATDADRIAGWSTDEQSLFVYSRNDMPAKVYRLNRQTGAREAMMELAPADRAGVTFGFSVILITSDRGSYAYSVRQELSELHWAEGLK